MRIWETVVVAGFLSITAATLSPSEALAQGSPPIPPIVNRDTTWGTVSNITMAAGAVTVLLMPRVYYNDPEATVGWKGRWHFSILAPAMTMTALTFLVDIPIREEIKSPRPGCTLEQTVERRPGSNCESFQTPSTQSFAAWGATGGGLGIFLVDTLKYSNGRFNVLSFLGNVALPLTLSVITSVGRGIEAGPGVRAYEDAGAVAAGAISGFVTGFLAGGAYALLQHPNCGYGNNIFCW